MFFKRATKTTSEAAVTAPPVPAAAVPAPAVSTMLVEPARRALPRPGALDAKDLRRSVKADGLGFKTTADLEPFAGFVGQDRATNAIALSLASRARDFNVFVCGPAASGQLAAVRHLVEEAAKAASRPSDWVRVHLAATGARALRLTTGRAGALADAMAEILSEIAETLPSALSGEDCRSRRRIVEEEARSAQAEPIEALSRKADDLNVALLRTPLGYAMAPMHDGRIVKPEVFKQLPEAMRREVEGRIDGLQAELESILSLAPDVERERHLKSAALARDVAAPIVTAALAAARRTFSDVPAVIEHLTAVESELIAIAPTVAADAEKSQALAGLLRPYKVEVLAAQTEGDTGAPVIELDTPSLEALQRALIASNGGYLIVHANTLLRADEVRECLNRAIRAGHIADAGVPFEARVILVGDRNSHQSFGRDAEFGSCFKITADLDDAVRRTPENEKMFARAMALYIKTQGTKGVDADGIARLIEDSVRASGSRERLSVDIGRSADLLREADHWARQANRNVISAADVARAQAEFVQRSDRMRDLAQDAIEAGATPVETDGKAIGQVNCLDIVKSGPFAFGRPQRLTARARAAGGRAEDIVAISTGETQARPVLWAYLGATYARRSPLGIAATLESTGAGDGENALAELYALLSTIADVPLSQSLAVTGGINQAGDVLPVSGINERIEGFFDVCSARGLTGEQGVVIAKGNVANLMLHEDVVEAVRADQFWIYAISSVDEGLEVLTGLKPGTRTADGAFAAETFNRRVEDGLIAFASGGAARAAKGLNGKANGGLS